MAGEGFFMVRPVRVTDAMLAYSSVAEPSDGEEVFDAETSYDDGDRVISTTTHGLWESAHDANSGNALPAVGESDEHWLWVGYNNRWAPLDEVISSQALAEDGLEYEFDLEGRIDTLAALNISGLEARVQSDAGPGYDETFSLVSEVGIDDWDKWFFEPVVRLTDLIVTDLPNGVDPTVNFSLSELYGEVGLGVLILGQRRRLGGTLYGGEIGIVDYSRFDTDAFGNTDITERAYSKTGSFSVWVDDTQVDDVCRVLALYRATAILYVADTGFTSTYLYGFASDWGVVLNEGRKKLLRIKIKSVI